MRIEAREEVGIAFGLFDKFLFPTLFAAAILFLKISQSRIVSHSELVARFRSRARSARHSQHFGIANQQITEQCIYTHTHTETTLQDSLCSSSMQSVSQPVSQPENAVVCRLSPFVDFRIEI